MYTNPGLGGFFLFDAAKTIAKAAVGAVSGAVKSVTGTASQTGSTTPVYVQQPAVSSPTNYTPWLLGGAAVLGVLLLTRKGR